jgi:pimeloyl-ACP methyl ester carboxylesterase
MSAPASPTALLQRWRWWHLLALAAGAILLVGGLWQLLAPRGGLDIEAASVDGIPITVFAPADAGAEPGPIVIVGHGFAGSQQLMHPFALTLARAGYRAITFDFPGHGDNPAPLKGVIGSDQRTGLLLDALSRVVGHARTLPGGERPLALLGHSMAGDIAVRHANAAGGDIAGLVAVSPYLSQEMGADGPPNVLFVYGELEPGIILDQGREAVAAVAGVPPADVETGVTYGSFADDSARRLVIAGGVEHIGVLYSPTALTTARDWLNRVFGREAAADASAAPAALGAGLGLFYLGVVLLAWPLARLLPRVAEPPRGAGLGWRPLLRTALAPAVLTPLILWPLPNDFLPIAIGDYIALHFLVYGLLTWLGLWLAGGRTQSTPGWFSWGAFLVAVIAVALFETLALMIPTDIFVASFVPGADRLVVLLVLLAGVLVWASADEWLPRGPGSRPLAYALTKLLFVVSLLLAVFLNRNELFFLVIIIPAILALFIVYGLFSGWIYRRTGHPWVAAVTNAIAFAAAITVSFPIAD